MAKPVLYDYIINATNGELIELELFIKRIGTNELYIESHCIFKYIRNIWDYYALKQINILMYLVTFSDI